MPGNAPAPETGGTYATSSVAGTRGGDATFAARSAAVAAAASAARTEPTTTPSSMTLRCFGGGGTLLSLFPAQRSTPAEASAFRTAANEGDGAATASAPETSTRATST
jgi:hypothetical protein